MIKQVGIVLSLDLVYERVVLLLESSDVILRLKREERYFKKSLIIPLYRKEWEHYYSLFPQRERESLGI